jgi:hypothetical protein
MRRVFRTLPVMTPGIKRSSVQPQPRERPDDRPEDEPGGISRKARKRTSRDVSREPERQPEPEAEGPDMGIGLDERGEIDRRFEP